VRPKVATLKEKKSININIKKNKKKAFKTLKAFFLAIFILTYFKRARLIRVKVNALSRAILGIFS